MSDTEEWTRDSEEYWYRSGAKDARVAKARFIYRTVRWGVTVRGDGEMPEHWVGEYLEKMCDAYTAGYCSEEIK